MNDYSILRKDRTKQGSVMDIYTRRLASYHEAGHAVMAWWVGGKINQCSIDIRTDDLWRAGTTSVCLREESERPVKTILVSLAGICAEKVFAPTNCRPHHADIDMIPVRAALEEMKKADRRDIPELDRFLAEVESFFRRPDIARCARRVARIIFRQRTIDGAAIDGIYQSSALVQQT